MVLFWQIDDLLRNVRMLKVGQVVGVRVVSVTCGMKVVDDVLRLNLV